MFYNTFLYNINIYIMMLNLSLLLSFFRLLIIFVEVLKVPKTLTFETSFILFSIETGVFPKPITIEFSSHQ